MRTAKVHLSDILLTALASITWGLAYVVATELLPPNHPLLVASLRSREDVQGVALDCGHFLPEESPERTAAELIRFLERRENLHKS